MGRGKPRAPQGPAHARAATAGDAGELRQLIREAHEARKDLLAALRECQGAPAAELREHFETYAQDLFTELEKELIGHVEKIREKVNSHTYDVLSMLASQAGAKSPEELMVTWARHTQDILNKLLDIRLPELQKLMSECRRTGISPSIIADVLKEAPAAKPKSINDMVKVVQDFRKTGVLNLDDL